MFSTENDFLKTRHSCTHAEMRKARAHCHATVQSKHILLNSQCGNFHSNSPLTSTNVTCLIYRVAQKILQTCVCLITSSNIDQFSNFFHCQNREKSCNKTITKDPPYLKHVATLPCEMSCLNATTENKTSETTHFKVRRPAARRTH